MKNVTLFLLCLLTCCLIEAQNMRDVRCYEYYNMKASIECMHMNYETAAFYLEKMECEGGILPKDALLAAIVYNMLGEKEKAFSHLPNSIIAGCTWYELEEQPYLNELKSTPEWEQLKMDYDSLHSIFKSKLDIELYSSLIEMQAVDQYTRIKLHAEAKEAKYMLEADSLHMRKLMRLIEEKGFPTFEEIGYTGRSALYLLLLHGLTTDEEAWVFFKDLLLAEVLKGNIEPRSYAAIYDRHVQYYLKHTDLPQWFGEYNLTRPLSEYAPIEDVANVDKRRLTIGLPTLKESVGYGNAMQVEVLPEGYIPVENPMEYLKCNCADETIE